MLLNMSGHNKRVVELVGCSERHVQRRMMGAIPERSLEADARVQVRAAALPYVEK